MKLTDKTKQEIHDLVVGYCAPNMEHIAELLGCDEGDIEDNLLDLNIEKCATCGYWFHEGGDVGENGEPMCSECVREIEETQ